MRVSSAPNRDTIVHQSRHDVGNPSRQPLQVRIRRLLPAVLAALAASFASHDVMGAPNDWGSSGPPPVIPRPNQPPEATRGSIQLKNAIDLPPAPAAGNTDVILTPIRTWELPTLKGASGPLPPIRLEASFIEPISLSDVLSLALENNLPIRMAKAQWKSDRFKVLSAVGGMLPSMAMGYNASQTSFIGDRNSAGAFYHLMYLPVFNGGQDLFHLLKAIHESKASRFVSSATINDALLDVYEKYQELLLQHALLDVRIKAVNVSQTQLQENEDRKAAGEGTVFEVLQSQTRLAQDQQLLLRQQVAFRQAALKLAVAINISPAINLMPQETVLSETLLVDPKLTIAELLNSAIDKRPELRQHEELRLAARRQIQERLAQLYPNAKFYLATNTTSKSDSGNSSSGVIIPAGNALSSGLVSTGGGAGATFTAGFILNWLLPGMGVINVGEGLASRELARKATLKANEVLLNVMEEVRSSYIEMLSTKEEITVSHRAVMSAREELRVADERVRYGVGTNLELLSAQRDYFEALAKQAETIVNYRKSQARLLRNMGAISIASLTEDKRPLRIGNGVQ
jgi:outer membrane protein